MEIGHKIEADLQMQPTKTSCKLGLKDMTGSTTISSKV